MLSTLAPPKCVENRATEVKPKWQEPESNGGFPIQSYELQMSSGGMFETVFEGLSLEHTVKQLKPQTSLKFQVRAKNALGYSEWSSVMEMITKQPPDSKCLLRLKDLQVYTFSQSSCWENQALLVSATMEEILSNLMVYVGLVPH